jgi:hypothetical protein
MTTLTRHRPLHWSIGDDASANCASWQVLARCGSEAWAKIGKLYIRKSAFERGTAWPQGLRVTVDAPPLAPSPS